MSVRVSMSMSVRVMESPPRLIAPSVVIKLWISSPHPALPRNQLDILVLSQP